ncbi:MAG: Lpg1974 family pore-forming outer membrane protein, partial [Planctomycetota bacterium]
TGLTNVTTDIDFHGFGFFGGLDFERYSSETGFSIYGKGTGSLMAGEWKASYTQTNQFGGGVIRNDYEDFHATPVIEAELGIAWAACGGHLRLHSGLMMSGWYDAVSTRSYVSGVRSGQLTNVGETMTFSGLVAGATWRF